MKKIILSALVLGSTFMGARAQEGSVLVYGQIGYHATKDASDNKVHNFNITPGIGYQFDKHWTVGLYGAFETNRSRLATQTEWNFSNSYGIGVFVRHTMQLNKIFSVYGQLQAGYIGTADGNTGINATTNSNGFNANYTPHIGVTVFDGFALNFAFGGLDFKSSKFSGATKSSTSFDFTWGSQVSVGVSKNISCGHMHKHHRGGVMMNHGSKLDKEEMMKDKEEDDSKD